MTGAGPDEALEQALAASRSHRWGARAAGVRALADHLPSSPARDRLVALLDDEDTAVVAEAAEGLAVAGGREGLEVALIALAEGPDDAGYHIRDRLIAICAERPSVLDRIREVAAAGREPARSGAAELLQEMGL